MDGHFVESPGVCAAGGDVYGGGQPVDWPFGHPFGFEGLCISCETRDTLSCAKSAVVSTGHSIAGRTLSSWTRTRSLDTLQVQPLRAAWPLSSITVGVEQVLVDFTKKLASVREGEGGLYPRVT